MTIFDIVELLMYLLVFISFSTIALYTGLMVWAVSSVNKKQ